MRANAETGAAAEGTNGDAHRAGQPNGRAHEDLARTTAALGSEFEQAFSAFRRALSAERQVLQLRLFELALRTALWACALLCASALALAAALLIVGSLRRGLSLWSGSAWWSDLLLGVLILASVTWGVHRARRAVHRRALKHVQSLLPVEPAPAQPTAPPATASPAGARPA